MRIGISCYSTFGGSGVVATEVGKALAGRGHEIHIFSPSLPPRLVGFEDRINFHEVRASPYPLFEDAPYSIALGSKMADVAEHHRLEIIHAHYAIPHAMAALLARMAIPSLKVVTTLHGTDITLVGRTVTVVRNGVTIIDHQEIAGITGGALDSNEGEPGPFYFQGDHTGGMKYRNMMVSVPE